MCDNIDGFWQFQTDDEDECFVSGHKKCWSKLQVQRGQFFTVSFSAFFSEENRFFKKVPHGGEVGCVV